MIGRNPYFARDKEAERAHPFSLFLGNGNASSQVGVFSLPAPIQKITSCEQVGMVVVMSGALSGYLLCSARSKFRPRGSAKTAEALRRLRPNMEDARRAEWADAVRHRKSYPEFEHTLRRVHLL